jgi:hypothetical protein
MSRRNVSFWSHACTENQVFHKTLGLEGEFNASTGWLTRLKRRSNIHEIAVQGEGLSANDTVANMFCIKFQKFAQEENLKPDQIYADESRLYWKGLPTRTRTFERQKCATGHKSSKEHFTVMCCGNTSENHKLKLVPIGKAKKPQLFKGTKTNGIPLHYYKQKGAWMDREII